SELLAGIDGAYHKAAEARRVWLPLAVRLEELDGFLNEFGILRDDAEAAAVLDVQVGEIEGQQEKLAAIDDHYLAVVARQVVGRARYGDSGRQQPHFKLAKVPLTAAIRICDEGVDRDTPRHRVRQRLFDLASVETKDQNLNALLGAVDRLDQRRHTVAGLHQQLHGRTLPENSFLCIHWHAFCSSQ